MLRELTVFILLLQAFAIAQDKTNVAVLDLSGGNISVSDTEIISSRLRSELVSTDHFNVIERKKMNELLKEQGIQVSGILSDSSIVQAGKLLGVKQMVTGTAGKIGELYTISIRLVDVESGRIVKTQSVDNNQGIEALLTNSVKSAARGLAGLEENTVNTVKGQEVNSLKKGETTENNSLNRNTVGERRAEIREKLKDAPSEIKEAALQLKVVNNKLLKLKQVENKNIKQKRDTARLLKARKNLIEKIKEWEDKN